MIKYIKLLFLILNFIFSGFLFSENVFEISKRFNHYNRKYCMECYGDISKTTVIYKENKKHNLISSIKDSMVYSLNNNISFLSQIKAMYKQYFKTIYFLYFLIFISFFKVISRIILFIRNFFANRKWGKTKKEYLEYKKEKEKKLNIEHQKSVELINAFNILGLTVGSSLNQVKDAYKDTLEKYHADADNKLNEEVKIENIKKLEEINNAYNLLKRIYKLK